VRVKNIMDWLTSRTGAEAPAVVQAARRRIDEAHEKMKPARDQWRMVRGALEVMAVSARGGGAIEDEDKEARR